MNKKNLLVQVIIMSVLMLPLMSCVTSKQNAHLEIPNIDYPQFPVDADDPTVSVTLSGSNFVIHWATYNKTVTIPAWFWFELIEYSVNVDSAISQYEAAIKNVQE